MMDNQRDKGRQLNDQLTRQNNGQSQQNYDRSISALRAELARMNEKLQILTGERGDQNKTKSAVRRTDISGVGNITMTATRAVGDPPTKAEFDALVDDVTAIYAVLNRIAGNLKV